MIDDKFLDSAYRGFEAVYPNKNRYIILSKKTELKYIKETPIDFVNELDKNDFINGLKVFGKKALPLTVLTAFFCLIGFYLLNDSYSFNGSKVLTVSGLDWDIFSIDDLADIEAGGIYAYGGADTVIGSNQSDRLIGYGGNDKINGNGGHDTLYGEEGDDKLNGGLGNDKLYGGAGSDTAYYNDATGAVRIDLSKSSTQYTLSAGSDRLISIENLVGSNYNDTLIGNSRNNTLNGGNGNDVLSGQGGNDTLIGGDGRDTADYGDATRGTRVDLNLTTSQNTVSSGMDRLISIENLKGTKYYDVLRGNSSDNILMGRGGNDSLLGGDGDDVLYGGSGNDRLYGQSGIDTADYGDATGGVLVDLQLTTTQNTVSAGMDRLTGIENLNGSNYDDQLTGNSSDNVLTGRGGHDVYQIGTASGHDTVDDSSGNDTVTFSGIDHGQLWFWQESNNLNITVAGTDNQVTIQNWYGDTANQVEAIVSLDESSVLLNTQVDQLVSAMASYSVPSGAGNVIPQATKDALQPVLAANWF